MQDLLTTRQLQDVLKVDRTTIYRIVKRGELPAIRVGNQWRFPRAVVEAWLSDQARSDEAAFPSGEAASSFDPPALSRTGDVWDSSNAHFIFPVECVQRIQDAFAEILDRTILVTGPDGTEITRSSHPNDLWEVARTAPEVRRRYRTFWAELGRDPTPAGRLYPDPVLGLLWSRALIRIGDQVRALAVVGGLAPGEWPPEGNRLRELATDLAVPEATLRDAVDRVPRGDDADIGRLLPFTRRLGDILEHIVAERVEIVDRMESIAELTRLNTWEPELRNGL